MLKRLRVLALALALGIPGRGAIQAESPPAFLEDIEKAVVLISHTRPGLETAEGSGFIATPTGLVITADHVIFDESKNRVYPSLFGQRVAEAGFERYELSVVKRFEGGQTGRDIAVLQIVRPELVEPLPYLEIAEPRHQGTEVLIAGFPLVFDRVYPFPLLRHGVVASVRYRYQGSEVVVLDMGGVDGFSGSPVVDRQSGMAIAVFRGRPKERPQTDFSVAFALDREVIGNVRENHEAGS